MLGVPYSNRFAFQYTSWPASPGTSTANVIPGASNAEGAWTQIASGANIANDCYLLDLFISAGASSGVAKNHLLDIGVDDAGGTSYLSKIANLACGSSAAQALGSALGGRRYRFPLFIKAGATVAARLQGSAGTAGSVRVVSRFYGRPSRPELVRAGRYSETIGADLGSPTVSLGTAFTPGNSGAEGTWTSLGVTTMNLWAWQLGVQCDNATMATLSYYFDLAYGDGTNMHPIITDQFVSTGNAETISSELALTDTAEVPAGSTIYVRGTCSGTADTGWNATAVGIGG